MARKNRDIQIIILTFLAVVASFSGWLVFEGMKEILGIALWEPMMKVVGGLALAWVIYKLGLKNKKICVLVADISPAGSMEKFRKKLDLLDNSFLELIKKRTKLVNQVLLTKKFKKDIVDKKRIRIILKNIQAKSKLKKIDPKITNKIWKSMIGAYIDYEYRNFKKK